MAAIVPVKVIVASLVPSPVVNVRPLSVLRLIAPLAAVSVTWAVRGLDVADRDLVCAGEDLGLFLGDRLRTGHGVDRGVIDGRHVERDRGWG